MNKNHDDFFEKLYLDNYKQLLKYAYRLTYMSNLAEEIVQDSFVEAYKKIELLYRHENPVGWLYIAVSNISKSYIREIVEMKKRLPIEVYELATTDEENIETFLLNYLSPKEAKIIIDFYVFKLSIHEMSEKYGISLSACKMRLKRARDHFFDKYESYK